MPVAPHLPPRLSAGPPLAQEPLPLYAAAFQEAQAILHVHAREDIQASLAWIEVLLERDPVRVRTRRIQSRLMDEALLRPRPTNTYRPEA